VQFGPLPAKGIGKNDISRNRKAKIKSCTFFTSNLVLFSIYEGENDVSRKIKLCPIWCFLAYMKGKMMFPGKLNCVQFKIGIDLYRTGNRMRIKSYADSYTDSYANSYV
jgi:hypothetical protein